MSEQTQASNPSKPEPAKKQKGKDGKNAGDTEFKLKTAKVILTDL
jgi:hypothetical protein